MKLQKNPLTDASQLIFLFDSIFLLILFDILGNFDMIYQNLYLMITVPCIYEIQPVTPEILEHS